MPSASVRYGNGKKYLRPSIGYTELSPEKHSNRMLKIDVRYRRYCGQHFLTLSISGYDPEPLSAVQLFCLARFLFNHLVGENKDRDRQGYAERFRGLHVDRERESYRLLDRQVRRLIALK